MVSLEGKTLLITGSSRGIGAATARAAYKLGARVICHGSKASDSLRSTKEEVAGQMWICDLQDEEEIRREAAKLLPINLDGLVNCAGTLIPVDLDQTSFADYEEALHIHLAAPSLLGSLFSETLKKNNGSIVNVSSVRSEAMLTSTRSAPYCTMKSALHNLTCIQAKEYSPSVRANTISPGWVETEMSLAWNEASRRQATSNLLGRVARSEEIAAAICFLLSDNAGFITGQNLFVDGGYGLQGK